MKYFPTEFDQSANHGTELSLADKMCEHYTDLGF